MYQCILRKVKSRIQGCTQLSNLIYLLTCTQCDSFYVGEMKNSVSTRMNGHRSSSWQFTPFGRHPYQISPTPFEFLLERMCAPGPAPLNLPTNSSCPLDTALALTSDNLHLNFPLTLHLFPLAVSHPLMAPFINTHITPFYHVFTYIYSLLIGKGICDHRNISSFCVFVFMFACTFIQRSHHFSDEFSLSSFTEKIRQLKMPLPWMQTLIDPPSALSR